MPVGAVICTIEVEGEGIETAETKQEEAPKAEAPAAPAQAAAPKNRREKEAAIRQPFFALPKSTTSTLNKYKEQAWADALRAKTC